jgi:hypothetical protein
MIEWICNCNIRNLLKNPGFVSRHNFTGVPIDRSWSMGLEFSRAVNATEKMPGFSPWASKPSFELVFQQVLSTTVADSFVGGSRGLQPPENWPKNGGL